MIVQHVQKWKKKGQVLLLLFQRRKWKISVNLPPTFMSNHAHARTHARLPLSLSLNESLLVSELMER